MPNPKTRKPQLCDYEYKGPRKRKLPVDVFGEDIDALPNTPTTNEERDDPTRAELDGALRFKK